jgi:hypothetical protein
MGIPISLNPIAWAILAGAILTGAYFLVDAIGDAREAKVMTRIAKAAEKKNLQIGTFNNEDEIAAAINERAVTEAEVRARGVQGQCPATPEQAAALTAIRRAR